MEVELFEPIRIIWRIGNTCNSNCKYCYTASRYSQKKISNKKWKLIVNELNKVKSIKGVTITGGEPLLIKELPKIIESLRKDIIINVDTNLLKIKENWNSSFKKACFCTTIDSINEKINYKTRGYSSKKVIEGIKFLLENKIKIMSVTVVSKYNIETLEETLRFLLELGVEKVGISKIRMIGRAMEKGYNYFYENLDNIKKKVKNIVEKLIKEFGRNKIILFNSWYDKYIFDLGYEYEPSCKCALFRACIDWKGYVYPCELMPFYWEKFHRFYNLKRPNITNSSLLEIFQDSELFKFFRERMLYYPIGCSNCNYKRICNHGCRFYSFLISGVLLSKDVMCGPNSVYDVIGYNYYSPLSKIGKRRWNSEVAKFIKVISPEIGKRVYDLGCGGGLWTFFMEDLGKEVVGIDNNETMLIIANEYKNLRGKTSKFVFADLRKYNYENFDSAIMLDNTISIFSKEEFEELLKKLKNKIKKFVVEISKNELREGEFNFKFNNFNILEKVKKKGKIYERFFFNKETGASFKILSPFWNRKILEKILKKYGIIKVKKETKNSYLYLIEF